MDSLFIYEDLECCCLNLLQPISYDGYLIYVKNKQCYLEKENLKTKLKKGQSIQIEKRNYLFLEEKWSVLPMKAYEIGRDPQLNLSFHSQLLSKKHASFYKEKDNWYIQDYASKNGTYQNTRRINHAKLKIFDEICMADLRFFFFDTFLLINQSVNTTFKPICIQYKDPRIWNVQKNNISFENTKVQVEIEMPISSYSQKKPHFITSIASSLSILITSLLFGILRFCFDSEGIEQVKTMLMTSGSMFLAFFTYGIWNYRTRIKEISNEKQQRKDLYLAYLETKKQEIWTLRQAFLECEEKNQAICLQWDESSYGLKHPLWIGKRKEAWIEISYPKLSYTQKEDALVKNVNKEIQEWEKAIFKNTFLTLGEKNELEDDKEDLPLILFMQWLWQNPSKEEKWIWIDPELEKIDRFFSLPCCQLNSCRLLASSLEEWNQLKECLDHSYQYIICSRIKNCTWNKKATWIYYDHSMRNKAFYFSYIRSYIEHTRFIHTNQQSNSFQLDWEKKEIRLKVDIGTRSNGTKIFLDFQDGKEGPHGIIAGMTGSGKSEWLSSVLMQLILKNSPEQLQYILIDFKGGAFGQAFYNYPHCAGMVTNLEGQAIRRWMQSMEFEIKKRQRMLRNFLQRRQDAIAHIDFYNNHNEKKISHLFVIFDEYAEFKSQYPDCALRIKEIARIGRSLGIHLLICTQKPMGVIDEQIWANSTFQVCLKVNSEADSREVIHDGQAAYLKQAGAFILFVNQKYEQGQGYYLHEKIFDPSQTIWSEINAKDEIIYQKKDERESILEACTKDILAKKKKRNWILYPDLKDSSFMPTLFKIDEPAKQKQVNYEMKKGEKIYLYWSNETELKCFLFAFIAQYQEEPILCKGYYALNDYVDGMIDSYDQISDESGTLIVLCTSKEEFKTYSNSNLRLLFLISNPWLSFHQDCQDGQLMSLSWLDLDAIRLFFNVLKVPKLKRDSNLALLQEENEILYCRYADQVPKRRTNKRIQIKQYVYVIGKDDSNGQKVLWKRENPLLILYAQKACEKWIFHKIQSFQEISPLLNYRFDFHQASDIYVIHANDFAQSMHEPLYIENQYDFDILWIGLGLSDFAHLIKRKCPYQLKTKMIYWSNQSMIECNDE